jgi:acetoin utilization deacetylase AcuC-like enzyme
MPEGEPVVLLLTDPATAGHASPGHPERPERVPAVNAGVAAGARAAGARVAGARPTQPAAREVLGRVHDAVYLDQLAALSARGGGWLDTDTYLSSASFFAATLAAGLSIDAARAVARGDAAVAFASERPPGHHAHAARGGGFCLINNVVVAAAALRAEGLARRIAILDWDVHHGDGTESLVASDPDTFYGSSHQYPWYPGTGAVDSGSDRVVSVPLATGSGDETFVSAWQGRILPAAAAFRPDAILVSAGYDAHRNDPLAGLEVTAGGFGTVATGVGELARDAGLRGVALVLEGGYDLDALRASAAATVEGLLAGLGHAHRHAGLNAGT